jgi:hypothetical protein
MSTTLVSSSRRRGISLTIRVSVMLMLAVVIPLLITAVGSELLLRPTLLSQAGIEMSNDAQAHQEAIDSLFIARLQDLQTLRNFLAVQKFLQGDTQYKQQARAELALGYHLDANYSAWSLFDTQGKALIAYPALPAPRGKYMVAPGMYAALQKKDEPIISDVYYDSNTSEAFVDIYASVVSQQAKLLGIIRSTLDLTEIWNDVDSETNSTPGSYALITDGHGVRIAYTNTDTSLATLPSALFQATDPISPQFQQRITDEDLYGNSHITVKSLPDPGLVAQKNQSSGLFQLTPALKNETYQAYQAQCLVVPWTYVVLRPVNKITQVANQQDTYLFLLAAIVIVLAAIIGLLLGRSITRPIQRSVASLIKNSEMLKTLANRERATVNEQKWIVDSAQTGLQSVQYYAEASNVAARKLDEIGRALQQNRDHMDTRAVGQKLNEVISTANYLEKAASHQEQSSKRLSTAIHVATQVTEQLLSGATSASSAADQLEEVISQLRRVVGE